MGLNAYQQAVSDLAKRLGLKGAGEQQVYQRPEYFQLIEQLYGKIPLPAGVDPSQIITNNGAVLEYRDADGFVHRLERDLNGTSSQLGQVRETSTDRPPILPPSKEQSGAEKGLNLQLLQQLQQQFSRGPSQPPQLPNFQGLQQALSMVPRAPQYDFSSLFGQLNQQLPSGPDLSGITGGLNNLTGQFQDVFSRLMQSPQLAGLQPNDLANLAAITASQQSDSDRLFRDQQGQLLAQLYGRGVNQSTIANRAAADFTEAQGRANLAISSDAAQRQLALQQFLTQQGQGNLALAGQTLGQQAQAGTNVGRLLLDQYTSQQGLNLQRLAQLQQAMQGAAGLGLQGYGLENDLRLRQLQQYGQNLFQGAGLDLQRYGLYEGLQGDFMNRALQLLNNLNQTDLSRQVSSGQLGLGQAELMERMRQFNQNLSFQQEQLRAQERMAQGSLFDKIMRGIGGGVSIASGLGGLGVFGKLFGGGGSGQIYGAGSQYPQN